jgi:hypothetical protein
MHFTKESTAAQILDVVVVAYNQPLLSMQFGPQFLKILFISKHHITQVINFVAWLYNTVPLFNHVFVHFFGRRKPCTTNQFASVAVSEFENVGVVKVRVTDNPNIAHCISSLLG